MLFAGLFAGLAALSLLVFWLFYRRSRYRMACGFFFDLFLGFFAIGYVLFAALHPDNVLLVGSLFVLAIVAVLLLAFGVYFLVAFLLLNARIVYKRERHTLANSLTLIIAIAILLLLVASAFIDRASTPVWLRGLWFAFGCVVFCYAVHVIVFLTNVLLVNLARPKIQADYIVVLGSGLVEGKVTPLLAARVKKGTDFAAKQRAAGGKGPLLVMSGGKGSDEARSEAAAMRDYAVEQLGVAEDAVLIEDQSTDTAENMRFSKALMDRHFGGAGYTCLFATSNYHLFRAGIYARLAGLGSPPGLGAKTALYYLPGALVREYIAFLMMHKKKLAVSIGAIFLLALLLFGAIAWLNSRFVY